MAGCIGSKARIAAWLAMNVQLLGTGGCGSKTELERYGSAIPGSSTAGMAATTSRDAGAGGARSTESTTRPPGESIGGAHASSGGSSSTAIRPSLCPDEWATSLAFEMAGDLGDFPNRYEPSCAYGELAGDYVLAWYVSEPDTYVISTLGSKTDTALAVYAGTCGREELVCNDDDAFLSRQSRVVLKVQEPGVHTLVVDGPAGPFVVTAAPEASLIDVYLAQTPPVSVHGTTRNRADTATSTCNGRISSSDMTFLFRPRASGSYRFEIDSANFDAVLSLRSGGPAGEELACNLPPLGETPALSFALAKDEAVAIVVDGMLGAEGEFELRITRTEDSGACCETDAERRGCIDPAIRQCVCASVHTCCSESWSAACVTAVGQFGCGATCGR